MTALVLFVLGLVLGTGVCLVVEVSRRLRTDPPEPPPRLATDTPIHAQLLEEYRSEGRWL